MNKIKFKIAAKTDVGLLRTNNEDNFQASSDLLVQPMRWVNNDVCQLGEKGALLVVADGMGGMNAGEVASRIAIDTIREEFTPENLTDEVVRNRFSIEKFMSEVVVKADNRIKETAKKRSETRGMGTTIVVAWLYDGILYVTWCGDSRAYVYNPKYGLQRLTKDHSYVQQLVDEGKLTDGEAFEFPDSNIITRCLSDSKQKARPESLSNPYKVCDNDVILLCTDGLCGMIRDAEIQPVIESNQANLGTMTDELVQAALNASGADNVTVCLCQIISGGEKPDIKYFTKINRNKKTNSSINMFAGSSKRKWLILLLCICCVIGGIAFAFFLFRNNSPRNIDVAIEDSIYSSKDTTTVISKDTFGAQDTQKDELEADISYKVEYSPRNVDDKLGEINIPNTDKKMGRKAGDCDSSTELNGLTLNKEAGRTSVEAEETRAVVQETLPEGISLQVFAQRHEMNSQDLKHLNPNISDWESVRPGTKLNVYKK